MAPPEFGFYAGAMILTQDTTPSHTLTPLPVGIVYINNYPLNALFDTGSQVKHYFSTYCQITQFTIITYQQ